MSTTRRVLFVINSLACGGAETQLMGVVRAAVEAGHDVRIATLLPRNDFAAEAVALGVPVWSPHDPDASWSVRHLARLARQIRGWRPEVTVSFLLQATLFVRLLTPLLRGTRRISSMRNERLESRLRSVLYRATCVLDDVVVVNSRSSARTLQAAGTLPRSDLVQVVYNGVDAATIRARVRRTPAETRARLGLGDGDVLVLGAGRLSPQKDWGTLVRAAALTAARVHVVVAGEGEQEAELRRLADGLGAADRVRMLGLRSDVADLLTAADALVLCSRYEGTPNVVLEALALDVPVIAPDVGACAELLVREGDVVLADRDPQTLAAALDALDRRVEHRATGPDPLPRFAWEVIGRQWVRLLEGREVPDAATRHTEPRRRCVVRRADDATTPLASRADR